MCVSAASFAHASMIIYYDISVCWISALCVYSSTHFKQSAASYDPNTPPIEDHCKSQWKSDSRLIQHLTGPPVDVGSSYKLKFKLDCFGGLGLKVLSVLHLLLKQEAPS